LLGNPEPLVEPLVAFLAGDLPQVAEPQLRDLRVLEPPAQLQQLLVAQLPRALTELRVAYAPKLPEGDQVAVERVVAVALPRPEPSEEPLRLPPALGRRGRQNLPLPRHDRLEPVLEQGFGIPLDRGVGVHAPLPAGGSI